ncbi:hypothetical protein J0910_16570 [Nocardiopsis sp. CNT-189]|uniref:hypothetical protein n=1 Tax=Nocardiopsis oceanisediminis TaxID=2816862 RepID=UPI003B342F71
MIKDLRRRRRLGKVRPGDGSALAEYRPWQLFSRSLFFLDIADPSGGTRVFAVDVRHLTEPKSKKEHDGAVGKSPAALYRDGVQVNRSNLPAAFPVPGGVVEVAATSFGLKRMHLVAEDGTEHALRPHPRSQEGLRAGLDRRFPRAGAAVGAAAAVVLLAALAVGLLHGIEVLTRPEAVAERVGTFTSPLRLPLWADTALGAAGFLAGLERAARLRHHWLIDSAAS